MIISKRSILFGCATLAVGMASGCALQQKKVEQFLKNPKRINWRTADRELRDLRSENANVAVIGTEGDARRLYRANGLS
jgi:hypothetical protein